MPCTHPAGGRRIAFLSFILAGLLPISAHALTSGWSASSGVLPDAITCPWTKVNNTPNQPQIVAGHLNIGTVSPTSNNTYYQQVGSALTLPSDSLVAEFRLRYVSGAASDNSRTAASIVIELNGFRGTGFFVGNNEIFFNSGNVTRGGTAATPTTDAMHTYRIVIVGTTTMRIYKDGVLKLTGSTYVDGTVFSGTRRILWGEGSSLAYGSSEWASVVHNAAPGAGCATTAAKAATWGAVRRTYR